MSLVFLRPLGLRLRGLTLRRESGAAPDTRTKPAQECARGADRHRRGDPLVRGEHSAAVAPTRRPPGLPPRVSVTPGAAPQSSVSTSSEVNRAGSTSGTPHTPPGTHSTVSAPHPGERPGVQSLPLGVSARRERRHTSDPPLCRNTDPKHNPRFSASA